MSNPLVLAYKGQRVLLTEQLAETYETSDDNLKVNFSNHKKNFIDGVHYFYLKGEELREFKREVNDIYPALISKFTSNLYLWTHRGSSRHCKILDTDKAWEQFDNLEETYFRVKEATVQLQSPHDQTKPFSIGEVSNLLKLLVSVMRKQGSPESSIAEQLQLSCTQFGIKTIPGFVEKLPFEQIALGGNFIS